MTMTRLATDPIVRAIPARLEVVAWTSLLTLALAVRVAGLGSPPLSSDEGRRALEGWKLWHEGRIEYVDGPVIPNVLSLIFGLFSDGDGQARLPSAIAGTVIVAVPWLMRRSLGSLGAWSIAAILASAPPFVLASRTVSSGALTACSLFAAGVLAFRFATDRRAAWLNGAFGCLAIGLGTDPSFAVALATLVLAVAIAEGDLALRPTFSPALRRGLPTAVATGLLTAVLVDTRMLMNPAGLQAGLVDPLWRWSVDVTRGGGMTTPILLLLTDGGVLGLAAIGLFSYRRRPRLVRLLGCWLLVALALASLMRHSDPRYLLQPLVPAALLAGLGLELMLTAIWRHGDLRSAIIALAALVPLIAAAFRINLAPRPGGDAWATAALTALGGFAIVTLVSLNWLRGPRVWAALAAFGLIISTGSAITTTSRLLEARGGPRAHLLEGIVLTSDLRAIRQEVLKWSRADPQAPIPVDPRLATLVGWALHDVPTVVYDVTAANRTGPRLLADSEPRSSSTERVDRLIVGYEPDPATLSLQPDRVWRWIVGRQSLVDVRPRAILVVQPSGT